MLIAAGNLTYLVFAAGVLWQHAETVSALGMAWFAAEAVVVMSIAMIELVIAARAGSGLER